MAKLSSTGVTEWLSSVTVSRVSGLSLDMVNYLCRYGIATPHGGGLRGRGRTRRYSYADALLLRVIAKLLANGVSVLRLRRAILAMHRRNATPQILTRKFVVTDGRDLYFMAKGG